MVRETIRSAMRSLAPCLLALLAFPASADTLVLAPARDNTIYGDNSSLSNGSGEHIFAGNTAFGTTRRALIHFPVASSLPPGARITGVRLVLELTQTIAGPETVTLHRLLASWGEGGSDAPGLEGGGTPAQAGDATWAVRFFPGSPWASPGGDFVAAPSASIVVDQFASYTWGSTAGLVDDVQTWLDFPTTNAGWILRGNETGAITAKRFDSRENALPANRPRLEIDFDPPCSAVLPFCVATANSTGVAARIGSSGSPSLSGNAFALTGRGLPPGSTAVFITAPGQQQAPFGNGFLCVAGDLKRLNPPLVADGLGNVLKPLDFTQPPLSGVPADATRQFQFVYRDLPAGGAGFNASNGLTVRFCL